jgi:hypothetical protein
VFYRLLFVLQLTQLTRNSCHKGNEEQKIPHRQKGSKIQSKITETETAPIVTHKSNNSHFSGLVHAHH